MSLGVCIVGAGQLGTMHAKAWKKLPESRLIAVVDNNTERAAKLAGELGFSSHFEDYRDALVLDEVNVVSVCTPAYYHPEVAVFAAVHGKHVLSEKPIALNLKDADRMINAAEANGVKLGIGFQRRFTEMTAVCSRLIGDGAIGRPVLWRRNYSSPIRTVVGKPAMHDMQFGNGGPVIDMCCHTFDLWRTVLKSEPEQVNARGFIFAQGRKELDNITQLAVDTAVVTVVFKSGDIGVVTITWGLPPGVSGGQMEDILGPDGAIVISPGETSMTLRRQSGESQYNFQDKNVIDENIKHFARTITGEIVGGHIHHAIGEDAKTALRVSLAALKSMKSGDTISILTNQHFLDE